MRIREIILFSSLAGSTAVANGQPVSSQKPNIIIILADDMGYSDIGCFGSEISTPNIDWIAGHGIRFTNFYNCARSCPTRASLMTGLFPHKAGIGYMSEETCGREGGDTMNWHKEGYLGYLNPKYRILPEMLKEHGYHTYLSGKWHLGMDGYEKWPLQRGFDEFFGILVGAGSYLMPEGERCLYRGNTELEAPEQPFYITDAITEEAIGFIREKSDNNPFFLYLSYTAPHWPLQANDSRITERYYRLCRKSGWNQINESRFARMARKGIIPKGIERACWESRNWNELSEEEKDQSAYRMAVYASQIHSLDNNIGKLIHFLRDSGILENTVIFFFSDNGACAEPKTEEGGGKQSDINNPSISVDGYTSYGKAWAQVSNTPYRKYKQSLYEGGIISPLIVYCPKETIGRKDFRRQKIFITDIAPTILDYCGADVQNYQFQGTSIRSYISENSRQEHVIYFWEHMGNRAVLKDNWKAVRERGEREWELYDISSDMTESHDISGCNQNTTAVLSELWENWAAENNVIKNFSKLRKNAAKGQ